MRAGGRPKPLPLIILRPTLLAERAGELKQAAYMLVARYVGCVVTVQWPSALGGLVWRGLSTFGLCRECSCRLVR